MGGDGDAAARVDRLDDLRDGGQHRDALVDADRDEVVLEIRHLFTGDDEGRVRIVR